MQPMERAPRVTRAPQAQVPAALALAQVQAQAAPAAAVRAPSLGERAAAVRQEIFLAGRPEACETEQTRREALERLTHPSAASGLDEQAALNLADKQAMEVHDFLRWFTPQELRTEWDRLCALPEPPSAEGTNALHGVRLHALQLHQVAERLFQRDPQALGRELRAAVDSTLAQVATARNPDRVLAMAGLRMRALYLLMDPRERGQSLMMWEVLPPSESAEAEAVRAQAILSLRLASQGGVKTREQLLEPKVYEGLVGKPDATWRIQTKMVRLACLNLATVEQARLRGLSLQDAALAGAPSASAPRLKQRLALLMLEGLMGQGPRLVPPRDGKSPEPGSKDGKYPGGK